MTMSIGIYSAISFAAVNLYVQQMNMKCSEVQYIAKLHSTIYVGFSCRWNVLVTVTKRQSAVTEEDDEPQVWALRCLQRTDSRI
jgi:hypothetical protein